MASVLLLAFPAAIAVLGVWRAKRWRALLWVIFAEGISIAVLAAAAAGPLGGLLIPMAIVVFTVLPTAFIGCLIRLVVDRSRSRLAPRI
jgi:hypothetical protein